MHHSITFIQKPLYTVDFSTFLTKDVEQKSKEQRISDYAKAFFSSIIEASLLTARFAPKTFLQTVFSYTDHLSQTILSPNAQLLGFRVTVWALSCTISTSMETTRLFYRKMHWGELDKSSRLSLFCNRLTGLHIDHLQTKELALDAKAVPASIQLEDLLSIWDRINFSDPNLPGYMAPSSLQEEGTSYTQKELKESLALFISRVKAKEPFIGTPPAINATQLLAFYQQIEDAVRLCLHKSKDTLDSFYQQHGKDLDSYPAAILKELKNALEDQNRLAIDLAIAGKHCGARYMGESISLYYSFFGQNQHYGSFKEELIELLAYKRKDILQQMNTSAHLFSALMHSLGELLGIPGSKHVTEHLTQIDMESSLQTFFKQYTPELIIDTVNERFKTSLSFRNACLSWLQDQVNSWSQEVYRQKETTYLAGIHQAMHTQVDISEEIKKTTDFLTLIRLYRSQNIPLPSCSEDSWDTFLTEVFSNGWIQPGTSFHEKKLNEQIIDIKNKWLQAQLGSNSSIIEQKKLIQSFQRLLAKDSLNEALPSLVAHITHHHPVDITSLSLHFSHLQQCKAIQTLMPLLDKETLLRIVQKKRSVHEAVHAYTQRERRDDFLRSLKVHGISLKNHALHDESIEQMLEKQELSPALMEWLLVSHQILYPQVTAITHPNNRFLSIEKESFLKCVLETSGYGSFLSYSHLQDILHHRGDIELTTSYVQKISDQPIVPQKRYCFSSLHSPLDQTLLHRIFMKGYANAPDQILAYVDLMAPSKKEPSLFYRRLICVTATEFLANSCLSLKTRAFLFLAGLYISYQALLELKTYTDSFASPHWLEEQIPSSLASRQVQELYALYRQPKTYQLLSLGCLACLGAFYANQGQRQIPHLSDKVLYPLGSILWFLLCNHPEVENAVFITQSILSAFYITEAIYTIGLTLQASAIQAKYTLVEKPKEKAYAVWSKALESMEEDPISTV